MAGFFSNQNRHNATNNNSSSAYINKSTKDLGEKNPYVKAKSEALLAVAKEMSGIINDNKLSLTTQKGTGENAQTVISSPMVKVVVVTEEEAGIKTPKKHKDGSFVFKASINMTIGSYGLTVNTYESPKTPEIADISSVTLSKFMQTSNNSFRSAKVDLFKQEETDKLPNDLKKFISILKEKEIIKKNNIKELYNSISETIQKNGEDNKFHTRFMHDAIFGDKVQVVSTNKDVHRLIEFGSFKTDSGKEIPTIALLSFNGAGVPPVRTPLKEFEEIQRTIKNATLFRIACAYKNFDEQTGERINSSELFSFSIEANNYFKTESTKVEVTVKDTNGDTLIQDGNIVTKLVSDCYAQYKEKDEFKPERVELRSHSAEKILIELRFKEETDTQTNEVENIPIVKITDFSHKDENGRFVYGWINSPEDLDLPEMDAIPEAIKTVVYNFKNFDEQEQEQKKIKKEEIEITD